MNAPAPMLAPITIIKPEQTSAMTKAPSTPEEELAAFEEKFPHLKFTDEQRARFFTAQTYKSGKLDLLHDEGVINMHPDGPTVSMRALLTEDANILTMAGELGGSRLEYDSRKSIAHVILAVGDGARQWYDEHGVPDDTREKRSIWRKLRTWFSGRGSRFGSRAMVGDHVFVLSTVADRASKEDRSCRMWKVHIEDISWRWRVPKPG